MAKKTFKSLGAVVSYIKLAQARVVPSISRDVENIIKETTKKNLYNAYSPEEYIRTGDMMRDMIQTKYMTPTRMVVGFEDNGGHTSWLSPHPHVFVAPILEAGGYTWEKGGERKKPTRIMEDSYERATDEVPRAYISAMASQGIVVKKK